MKTMSTIFITEADLNDGATREDTERLVKYLRDLDWPAEYGAGPAWSFADPETRHHFDCDFDRALRAL